MLQKLLATQLESVAGGESVFSDKPEISEMVKPQNTAAAVVMGILKGMGKGAIIGTVGGLIRSNGKWVHGKFNSDRKYDFFGAEYRGDTAQGAVTGALLGGVLGGLSAYNNKLGDLAENGVTLVKLFTF